MRKVFIYLLVSLSSLSGVFAQLSAKYTVQAFTTSYDTLVGATSVNAGQIWDDNLYLVHLPFTFNAVGKDYDSLWVDSNGNLYLEQNSNAVIFSNSGDLIDMGTQQSASPLFFQTSGAVGNRIAKFEYRNAGFFHDSTHTAFTNLQIWLYEKDNSIEFHYGETQATLDLYYAGFFCGVGRIEPISGLMTSTFLVGDIAQPDTFTFSSIGAIPTLDSIPTLGQVYRLMPPPAATTNELVANASFSVFPNPTSGRIQAKLTLNEPSPIRFSLQTLLGETLQTIEKEAASTQEVSFDLSTLASGFYLLVCDMEETRLTRKIILK